MTMIMHTLYTNDVMFDVLAKCYCISMMTKHKLGKEIFLNAKFSEPKYMY